MANPNRQRKHPKTLLQLPHEKLSNSCKNPPSGYTFVPKGNVYITRHCRILTEEAGRTLWIVHSPVNNLRLGLHVPTNILHQVQANEAATADYRKNAVIVKDRKDLDKARGTLLKLFPRVPLESAEIILSHGYLKGSGRVGRTSRLTDEAKMRLAVAAHVRHKLTSYDSLLREYRKKAKQKGPPVGKIRDMARKHIHGEVQQVLESWGPSKITSILRITTNPSSLTRNVKGQMSNLEDRNLRRGRAAERVHQRQRKVITKNLDQQQQDLTMNTSLTPLSGSGRASRIAVTSNRDLKIESDGQQQMSEQHACEEDSRVDKQLACTRSEDSESYAGASIETKGSKETRISMKICSKELIALKEISNRLPTRYTASPGRVTRQTLRNRMVGSSLVAVARCSQTEEEYKITPEVIAEIEAYKVLINSRLKRANRSAEAAGAALAQDLVALTTTPQDARTSKKIEKAIRKSRRSLQGADTKALRATGKHIKRAHFDYRRNTFRDG